MPFRYATDLFKRGRIHTPILFEHTVEVAFVCKAKFFSDLIDAQSAS